MATPHDDDGDDDNLSIPNLPEHWDFGGEIHPILGPRNPILFIHRLLCIISFGCANLQTVWAKTHTSAWRSTREDMKDRMQHTSIMAGLLLTTVSAFCTTEPPAGSRILPYTKTIPYCLFVASMGSISICIVLSAGGILVVQKMSPGWFREAAMGSRSRIWMSTIGLALPFLNTVASMVLFAAGVIVAGASSEVPWMRYGLGLYLLPALVTIAALLWYASCRPSSLGLFLMSSRC